MKDGDLSGIILQKPRRFNRLCFLKPRRGKEARQEKLLGSDTQPAFVFFAEKNHQHESQLRNCFRQNTGSSQLEKFLADSPLAEGLAS